MGASMFSMPLYSLCPMAGRLSYILCPVLSDAYLTYCFFCQHPPGMHYLTEWTENESPLFPPLSTAFSALLVLTPSLSTLRALTLDIPPPPVSAHGRMFGGPVHILFAQCIPEGSLFMSIFLLIRVRLPHFVPVSERSHLQGSGQGSGILGKVYRQLILAKLFLHMVNYLCKVILTGV